MAKGGTNNGKGWDKQWPQVGITVAKGGMNSGQGKGGINSSQGWD